jgi:hypothetical protein
MKKNTAIIFVYFLILALVCRPSHTCYNSPQILHLDFIPFILVLLVNSVYYEGLTFLLTAIVFLILSAMSKYLFLDLCKNNEFVTRISFLLQLGL